MTNTAATTTLDSVLGLVDIEEALMAFLAEMPR